MHLRLGACSLTLVDGKNYALAETRNRQDPGLRLWTETLGWESDDQPFWPSLAHSVALNEFSQAFGNSDPMPETDARNTLTFDGYTIVNG